ncbi:alkaline phosphatase family protein [Streptomyces sp. NBC_00388]|uniref:alkaline phosphatase family protein n=1 Tax=Streptomyces sp. NBC_00388 TaxID=2975735 RepID=UPI002E2257BB
MSTAFRSRLAALTAAAATHAAPRHLVVLAVDGLPFEQAVAHWPHARTERLTSVRPTTSSAGWLSSLTGCPVAEHGVPGVVFSDPGGSGALINVMEYAGPGLTPVRENIFSDAARSGLRPLAVLGDLEAYPSSWRDALLRHAEPVTGHRFYTGPGTVADGSYRPPPPGEVAGRLRSAIGTTLARYGGEGPCLLWCFVELDRHVHHHGYDSHVQQVLTRIGTLAQELADRGVAVAAHADHGLTPTRHDPGLQLMLDRLGKEHRFTMGGAGRVRWLYPQTAGTDRLATVLRRELPHDIRLVGTEELLEPGSLAGRRAGPLTLIAEGTGFLTDPAYTHDHGSASPAELYTPLSTWGFEGKTR